MATVNGGNLSVNAYTRYSVLYTESSTSSITVNYGTFEGNIENKGTININQLNNKETLFKNFSHIRNDAELNINGGTLLGTAAYDSNSSMLVINNGTMNMNNGTLTDSYNSSTGGAAIKNTNVLNLIGGELNASSYTAINNTATLNLGSKGGETSSSNPIIKSAHNGIITSGTFNFYDGIIKANSDAYNTPPTEIEDGYDIITESDASYSDIKFLDKRTLVSIGEEEFNNFEDAIEYCKDNTLCEMTLLRDVSYVSNKESIVIPSTKNIKVDMDSHKLITSGKVLFVNQGTAEFSNGFMERPSGTVIENIGNLTLSSMDLLSSANNSKVIVNGSKTVEENDSSSLVDFEVGSLTVNNGTIINCTGENCIAIYNTSNNDVTIKGQLGKNDGINI